jgi:hypothetical protein
MTAHHSTAQCIAQHNTAEQSGTQQKNHVYEAKSRFVSASLITHE